MTADSTQRFSSRVADYVKYRPQYPLEALRFLREACGLVPGTRVADVGSGTGILTAQLLEAGLRVWAVEPNRDMREAAEQWLGGRAGFTSVAGTAEATTLAAHSVEWFTAGQAFHWFDPHKTRHEALRILVEGGKVALLWNERTDDPAPLQSDYEALLRRHAPEYDQVRSMRAYGPTLLSFFGREPECRAFANQQVFDFEGLKGRAMSSSYVPEPGHPDHAPLLAGLRELFERHQRDGRVVFPYKTLVFFGTLA
ncbi:MAG: class I SAM-dependent methyltransferase [Steroidobacteraceae bacterium]